MTVILITIMNVVEKDDELCERQSCDRPIDLRCLKCKKYLCYR